jgi:hypothetical protein
MNASSSNLAPPSSSRLATRGLVRRADRAAWLAVLSMLLLAGTAREASASDVAAEVLYQEGQRAADAHDWSLACQKFRESHAREPAPGTLLNIANCEEKLGELNASLAHYEAVAALVHDDRAKFATERAKTIRGRIPKLVVRLAPSIPSDARVERDGKPLPAASLGVPLLVDPGEHTLVLSVPGRADARMSVRLAERETRDVVLAAGPASLASTAHAVPVLVPATADAGPAAEPSSTSPPSAPFAVRHATLLRGAGYASLGLGALGLGTGLVGLLATANAKSEADAECINGCTPAGLEAQDRGKSASTLATAGFVASGVGFAAGAALLVVLPRLTRDKTPTVGAAPVAGGAVFGVAGSF